MNDYDFDLDENGQPIFDEENSGQSVNNIFNIGHNVNQALNGVSGVIDTLNNAPTLPLVAGIGILGYFLLNRKNENGNH